MEWFLKVLREYANFNGRARRKEYWMFYLFTVIFAMVFYAIVIIGLIFKSAPLTYAGIGLYALFALIIFIPGMAVSVRRMHDVGKSGWTYLITLIPLVGPIWLLVQMCTESVYGENKWGPNPKDFGNQNDIGEIGYKNY